MKKVILAIDSNAAGGAERVVATLANFFSYDGIETIVVNSDSKSNFYELDQKVRNIKLKLSGNKVHRMILKYKRLRSIFMMEKPDAVICFLFRMEVPVIVAGLRTDTKIFTSVRNSANAYAKHERLFRLLFYPKIAGVVFQSEAVMNFHDFSNINKKCVIGNPLSLKYMNIEPIDYSKRKKCLISVGRLTEQKNHEMTIRSFAKISRRYSEFELHIFGDGLLHDELCQLINQLSLQGRVFLDGEVNDAIFYNKDSFLFVMSSNYEGFPNALAEAMAAGIPCISTDFDSGVARELICDGENGFLCQPQAVDQLTSKIEMALRMDRESYNKMAKNACSRMKEYYPTNVSKIWERFIFQ